jgi:hypothetical protein
MVVLFSIHGRMLFPAMILFPIDRRRVRIEAMCRVKLTKLMRRKIKLTEMKVYEFFRQLAMLGGFLGRKHDGEPGWQTTWRGYLKLHQTNIGIELRKRLR